MGYFISCLISAKRRIGDFSHYWVGTKKACMDFDRGGVEGCVLGRNKHFKFGWVLELSGKGHFQGLRQLAVVLRLKLFRGKHSWIDLYFILI